MAMHAKSLASQLGPTGGKVWLCGRCAGASGAAGGSWAAASSAARRSVRRGLKSVTVRSWTASVTGCSIHHAGG